MMSLVMVALLGLGVLAVTTDGSESVSDTPDELDTPDTPDVVTGTDGVDLADGTGSDVVFTVGNADATGPIAGAIRLTGVTGLSPSDISLIFNTTAVA